MVVHKNCWECLMVDNDGGFMMLHDGSCLIVDGQISQPSPQKLQLFAGKNALDFLWWYWYRVTGCVAESYWVLVPDVIPWTSIVKGWFFPFQDVVLISCSPVHTHHVWIWWWLLGTDPAFAAGCHDHDVENVGAGHLDEERLGWNGHWL